MKESDVWQKPTVTEIPIKDTESGNYQTPIEDPNYHFYGPNGTEDPGVLIGS